MDHPAQSEQAEAKAQRRPQRASARNVMGCLPWFFLTLGIGALYAVPMFVTYSNLKAVYDDDESVLMYEDTYTLKSLCGVLSSSLIAPLATVFFFGLAVRFLWRRSYMGIAAIGTRNTMAAVLPWLALVVLQASLAISGYIPAMRRWAEVFSDANEGGTLFRPVDYSDYHYISEVEWTSRRTGWAQFSYRFGYFAVSWYLLLWVYIQFMRAFEPPPTDETLGASETQEQRELHELPAGAAGGATDRSDEAAQ